MNLKFKLPFHKKKDPYQKLRLLAAGIGLILVWYGVWEYLYQIPFLNHPLIALAIGVILLVTSGLFFEEIA